MSIELPAGDVCPPLHEDLDRPDLPGTIVWDLDNISDVFAARGLQGKIRPYMILQLCLSVYYAVVYSADFSNLNAYYTWTPGIPPINASNIDIFNRSMYRSTIYYIVSTDYEIECNGTFFYRNETGPLYDTSYYNATDGIVRFNDISMYESVGIFWVLWGLLLIAVVSFVTTRLYVGKYNQLLYLVSFKQDKKENKLVPVKLHIGFTILCNAKSFSNLFFEVMCKLRPML